MKGQDYSKIKWVDNPLDSSTYYMWESVAILLVWMCEIEAVRLEDQLEHGIWIQEVDKLPKYTKFTPY